MYLALIRGRRDQDDYLVWVETDQDGRIRDRGNRENNGIAEKNSFEERRQNNVGYERQTDKTKIRLVNQPNIDFVVTLSYENSSGETYEKKFKPFTPWYLQAYISR